MRLLGHTGTIHDVSFSPDGRLLATGGGDNTLRVWDLESGLESIAPVAHQGNVYGVACSPTEPVVVTGSGNQLRMIDLATGEVVGRAEHRHSVYRLAFSPDGAFVASGGNANRTYLYETATGRLLGAGEWQAGDIVAVAYSPDGSMLAAGSADRWIKVYDPATGRPSAGWRTADQVNALAFSPDGSKLVAGDGGGLVSTWDPATGDLVGCIDRSPDPIYAITATMSPVGAIVAIAGAAPTVELLDLATGEVLATTAAAAGDTLAVAFSRDGTCLAAGGADDSVEVVWLGEGAG